MIQLLFLKDLANVDRRLDKSETREITLGDYAIIPTKIDGLSCRWSRWAEVGRLMAVKDGEKLSGSGYISRYIQQTILVD